MISTYDLGEGLSERGFDFYSGVPCSYLKSLINYSIDHCEYFGAANEGDAVAIASGASLGGRRAVVLMQNSGLTNAVSPLTSLNFTFKIPVLGFVSLRGESGIGDEPQHELMGKVTTKLLELMDVEWDYLEDNKTKLVKQLDKALECYLRGKPFFFVVRKGTIEEYTLQTVENAHRESGFTEAKIEGSEPKYSRNEVLSKINSSLGEDWLVIATTGHTGRELFEVEDKPNQIYMVGSMGCASSLGLGLAKSNPNKKILVIDGDGALLMRMGNLPTIGAYSPDNLFHLCLDNGAHASTGGQSTVSSLINLPQIVSGSGYSHIYQMNEVSKLESLLKSFRTGLTFVHFPINRLKKDGLGRPTLTPFQVKTKFMEALGANH